jgi:3-dehydroquinate synthase
VIKYGIIYDARLFNQLEKSMARLLKRDPDVLGQIIERCCAIKAEVVGQDETEGGLRAILNFGHTIGHALEAISKYGKYLHGEAISVGQVAAARLSESLQGFSHTESGRILNLFTAAGLPTTVRLNEGEIRRLLTAMRLDKKVVQGAIKFVLAEKIGKVKYGCDVAEGKILQVLESLR